MLETEKWTISLRTGRHFKLSWTGKRHEISKLQTHRLSIFSSSTSWSQVSHSYCGQSDREVTELGNEGRAHAN